MGPVRQLNEAVPRLRDRINETVTAAIWSDNGPTIIAMEESDHLVTMNLRIGSVLPLIDTAIGRLFLAYLPSAMTQRLVAAERRAAASLRAALPSGDELDDMLADIRRKKLSRVRGALLPGVDALAAPVFDYRAQAGGGDVRRGAHGECGDGPGWPGGKGVERRGERPVRAAWIGRAAKGQAENERPPYGGREQIAEIEIQRCFLRSRTTTSTRATS